MCEWAGVAGTVSALFTVLASGCSTCSTSVCVLLMLTRSSSIGVWNPHLLATGFMAPVCYSPTTLPPSSLPNCLLTCEYYLLSCYCHPPYSCGHACAAYCFPPHSHTSPYPHTHPPTHTHAPPPLHSRDQTAFNEEIFFLSHGEYKSPQVRMEAVPMQTLAVAVSHSEYTSSGQAVAVLSGGGSASGGNSSVVRQ